MPGSNSTGGRLASASTVIGAILGVSLLVWPELYAGGLEAWQWFSKSDSFQSQVSESQPLVVLNAASAWNTALLRLSGFSLLLGHPDAIQMEVPVFYSDRRVGFKTRKLRTAPTSTCHLRIGKDGRSIIGEWPPPDADLPKSVSPEAESETYYGPLQYDPDKRLDFGDIQVP